MARNFKLKFLQGTYELVVYYLQIKQLDKKIKSS